MEHGVSVPNFSELYQDSWFIFAGNDFSRRPRCLFAEPGARAGTDPDLEFGAVSLQSELSAKVDFTART
jgi:hypothetical protein